MIQPWQRQYQERLSNATDYIRDEREDVSGFLSPSEAAYLTGGSYDYSPDDAADTPYCPRRRYSLDFG